MKIAQLYFCHKCEKVTDVVYFSGLRCLVCSDVRLEEI